MQKDGGKSSKKRISNESIKIRYSTNGRTRVDRLT